MPVAYVDDVHHLVQHGVGQEAVLYVAGAAQGDERMKSRLSLPLGDSLQPEPGEVIGTGIFCTDEVNNIRLVFQLVKAHADVLAVQGA